MNLKRTFMALLLFEWTVFHSNAATAKEVLADYMSSNRIPILSTETNELRASGKFGFRAQLTVPAPGAESPKTVSSITLLETADAVVCAVTTTNGLPFSYMTDGLSIGFLDRTRPGTLACITDGNLGWGLSGGATKGEILLQFGLDRGAIQQPTVFLNLSRVFHPVFWETEPSYDRTTKELIFTGAGGKRVYLRLNGDKTDPFGFSEIRLIKGETMLRIYDIRPKLVRNSLPKLAKRDFESLGLQVSSFDRAEKIWPTPPADFPKDEAEREAALRMRKLLNIK